MGFDCNHSHGAMRMRAVSPSRLILIAALCFWQTPAVAAYNHFLALREVSSRDLSPFDKWTGMLARQARQKVPEGWGKTINALRGAPLQEQMDRVNRTFNALTYIEDSDNWNRKDYWATPYEMIERGGDCEDYAIAKYMALKQLGVSEQQMRIVIVQDDNLGGIIHAVLEVKHQGTAYLLDNQATRVVAASKVFHYRPVYAINAQQWWAYK